MTLALNEDRIGLVGNNGSGKSTLLRLASGLILPDVGSVTVAGLDTARCRKELPAAVGFVFQNPDHQILFPTVGEEIAFALIENGLEKKAAHERTVQILAAYDCAGWEDRSVQELSDGQKQLVCILAVIAPAPSIILFDEPFASLDLPTRLALGGHLARLPQRLVMASHDLDLLSGFDRVIWLQDGGVRADGPASEVILAYQADAREAFAADMRVRA